MKIVSNKIILPLIVLLFNLNCFAIDDFTHTLNLAKYSACKDVVEHTQQSNMTSPALAGTHSRWNNRDVPLEGGIIIQLSKLKALSSGPFPWRFEVTNGYQEGFVYYALLGYANELSGDIPYAYRCYQNSLACVDEDKSFDHPLPRAEIYLAIGRTCLAAGRYMDAKNWLDTAFLEAGDNETLQAAIDRVLIKRANEIGDYPEVIFLYQHLLSMAQAFAGSSTNDNNSPPLKGETGGCKNSPPVLGGVARSDGVVERTTDHGLRTTDYANYSQILFYSHKNREGFSKLLEGISKLGIDNNLGVKDPLVDKFLNNIMRADDDEVKWFYDLLGWAIVDARAKAGDENFLAFLCNARTLFCKVYDFLNPEDDLKKVKKRIDVVKEQPAQGFNPFTEKYSVSGNRYLRSTRRMSGGNLKISKSGEMEKTPGIILEDLLMLADWKLKQKQKSKAETNYYLASQIATGRFANIEYDGTTMENAAVMGLLLINPKSQIENPKFFDGSFRAAELTLQLYQKATNDKQRAEYDTEVAVKTLPVANPATLNYLLTEAHFLIRQAELEKAITSYKKYIEHKRNMPLSDVKQWCSLLFSLGEIKLAFEVALNMLKHCDNYSERVRLAEYCLDIWPYASLNELNQFSRIIKSAPLAYYLIHLGHFSLPGCLVKAVNWKRQFYGNQFDLINAISDADYNTALEILTNNFNNSKSGAHDYNKAIVFLAIGETNIAFAFAMKALTKRCKLANKNIIKYSASETQFIEPLLENVSTNLIEKYELWLNENIEKYLANNWQMEADCANQTLLKITKQ